MSNKSLVVLDAQGKVFNKELFTKFVKRLCEVLDWDENEEIKEVKFGISPKQLKNCFSQGNGWSELITDAEPNMVYQINGAEYVTYEKIPDNLLIAMFNSKPVGRLINLG